MDLAVVLQNAQHPSLEIRNQAEAYLNQYAETQYEECFIALCKVFVTEGKDLAIRQLAGLYMKNLITAKDDSIVQQKVNRWNNCNPAVKEEARKLLIQTINSPVAQVCHTAAQVIAAYGAVDVPNQAWPNLLSQLFGFINSQQFPDCCKIASLEALGYMCEVMIPDSVEPATVNQILTSIVEGMKPENKYEIRLAAVAALNNSLDFTGNNFENEAERNHIMTAVCMATKAAEAKVRERAFECCSTIAELYYDKLSAYAEALYTISVGAIKSDDPEVGMQAIEFWNVICDQEENIIQDIEEGIVEEKNLLKLTHLAAPSLVPLVLECMTKQEDDDDDDDTWNIAKAGATLLEGVSRTIRTDILGLVLPFVQENIVNSNWRFKEAAILSFGMILEGPDADKLQPLIAQAMPILIPCLKDGKSLVRDTTAWTIGRICELHKSALRPEILPPMVDALLIALDDPSINVVSQSCYAFYNLAEACSDESEANSNVLSHFMQSVVTKLMGITSRNEEDYKKIRSAAYETINKMVENSALDMNNLVVQLLVETLKRLNHTFEANLDANERSETQSALCGVIGEIIKKLEWRFGEQEVNEIMQTLLKVLYTPAAVAHEEALIAVGYIAQKMGASFSPYVQSLIQPLYGALKSIEAHSLCTVAVGVVGDLCRALNHGILPYCDDIMHSLLALLQSPVVNRSVKPHVISVFADISMAIEGDFERYCKIILEILKQAGEITVKDTDDEDLIEYVNVLRNSILEAYTGIIQGLKPANKLQVFFYYLPSIVDFLRRSAEDTNRSGEVLKSAIGLLGDLGQAFGNKMLEVYNMPFVASLIQEGSQNGSDTQDVAEWTQSVIISVQRSR